MCFWLHSGEATVRQAVKFRHLFSDSCLLMCVQHDYTDHGPQPRDAPRGPPPMRPHVPFDGTTTSRDAFQGWQLPPKFPGAPVVS